MATNLSSEIDDLTLRPTPQLSDRTPSVKDLASSSSYEPVPEDFFKTIFYFSGMGTVIGTALNEGVHVDERQRARAVDVEHLPHHLKHPLNREEYPLVVSCRNQAHNIYNGLKNLHTLLDQVPTYTESDHAFRSSSRTGPAEVKPDDPIHGSKYFRQNRMLAATNGR